MSSSGVAPATVALPQSFQQFSGSVFETLPRQLCSSTGLGLVSGQLNLFGISLPKKMPIKRIGFTSSRNRALGNNLWYSLHDANRNLLAVTADAGAVAWVSNETKILPIAQIAAGAATEFDTTYAGLHYIGIMDKVTTTTVAPYSVPGPSTFWGTGGGSPGPALAIGADTGLSGPPAFPFTAALNLLLGNMVHGFVAST